MNDTSRSKEIWMYDGQEYVTGEPGEVYTIKVSRARSHPASATAATPVALCAFVDGNRVLCGEGGFLPLWPNKSRTAQGDHRFWKPTQPIEIRNSQKPLVKHVDLGYPPLDCF